MMACHVDHEELERRAHMWAHGMSLREMAKECYVTYKTMQCYVCRHREFFPHRHAPSTTDERNRARAMRADGMTYEAIADALSRDIDSVWQWCKHEKEDK